MLRTALEFLKDELNLYLRRKDPANFGNADAVIISNLVKPDGSFAISTGQGNENFRVIITLVNLEPDHILDSQRYWQTVNDKVQVINPPLNVNVYALFSVFANNYATALRLLSYVLSFFQANPVFDSAQFPSMNANADKPWQKIGKMLVSMQPLTLEQQNNLWASLGAKHMPGVYYQIRTFSFQDIEPKQEAPPITEVKIFDN
jgi:hypothetical protein